MKYIEQSYKDLHLYLTTGAFDVRHFHIVTKGGLQHLDLDIDYGILTESHFVTIKSKGLLFNEFFACTDITMDNNQKFNLTQLENKKTNTTVGGYQHTFMAQALPLEAGKVRLAELCGKQSEVNTYYLSHTFPTLDPGEEHGLTELYISINGSVTIESIHTYPNEDVYVFSRSELRKIQKL